MKELSLHILDIINNSLKAGASLVEVTVEENLKKDILSIVIKDNGCGMEKSFVDMVKDPFTTTRTTRKAGLGIPLLEAASSQCDGRLDIASEVGKGTTLNAVFKYSHIDRAPIGDMAGTMVTAISGSPDVDFIYIHQRDEQKYLFDTRKLKEILGEVPLDTPEVLLWIENDIRVGVSDIGAEAE